MPFVHRRWRQGWTLRHAVEPVNCFTNRHTNHSLQEFALLVSSTAVTYTWLVLGTFLRSHCYSPARRSICSF